MSLIQSVGWSFWCFLLRIDKYRVKIYEVFYDQMKWIPWCAFPFFSRGYNFNEHGWLDKMYEVVFMGKILKYNTFNKK